MKATPATAAELLRATPLAAVDARALLAHVLGWSRAQMITRGGEPLDAGCVARYLQLEARRAAGEPVAQLVGSREFYGLTFEVTPDVLIPRPETELLVDIALDVLDASVARDDGAPPRVLDLGTGSGALAIAIASARPRACVWALDRSAAALEVARRNAQRLLAADRPGGAPRFAHSDWYTGLDRSLRFELIVSNPPYIAARDPHLSQGDLRFEPRDALTDGASGLDAIRAVAAHARAFLAPGGAIWIEHGYDQADAVRAILAATGLLAVDSRADYAGIARVTGGRTPT